MKTIEYLFGFCMHPSKEHNCPGRFQRWYIGKVKEGRRRVDGVVYLDEWAQCTCWCHDSKDEKKSKQKSGRSSK